MSPSLRVLAKALPCACVVLTLGAGWVSAQQYEPELRALDLATDVSRSPRLLAMGRLSLAIPDGSNALDLWDFAANPLGVYGDDSVSTVELRTRTGSLSAVRDLRTSGLERQTAAGQSVDLPFEAWSRDRASATAFGLAGSVGSLRADQEQGADLERRRAITLPEATPILTGRMPLIFKDKMRYAVRLQFADEQLRDEYRRYTHNAVGEWLDGDGEFRLPPNTFDPDEQEVRTQGVGVHLGYPVARGWTLTAGADLVRHRLHLANENNRFSSNVNENRPVGLGETALVGRFGDALQWITDARGWTSRSEQSWVYTIAGGVGQAPLAGRGKLLGREELGSSLRSRAQWRQGALVLGAQVETGFRRVTITPPDPNDRTSLNHFLNTIYATRQGADSLAFPDSVVANRIEQRDLGFGVGASWRFPRGVAGVEFHRTRNLLQQDLSGIGPRQVGWDLRGGLEYQCNPVVTGRLGWIHRRVDHDRLTQFNEFLQNTASLGLGLTPVGSSWALDLAYGFQWEQADFGDPTLPRAGRQNLSALVRWLF